jgi:CRISPR-associated protein Cmr5
MPDPTSSAKPTRDQERAQKAFLAIEKAKNSNWKEDYGRQCLRLPTLIQQEGLCLTLAFFEAKAANKKYFGALLTDFLAIVGSDSDKVRKADAVTYQRLSREALRTALWFKRYAEAVLDVTPEGDR